LNSKESDRCLIWTSKMLQEALSLTRQCLSSRTKSREEILAGKCLLENMSYRLDSSAANDRLVGFKETFRILKRMNSVGDCAHTVKSFTKSNCAVLSGAFSNENVIIDYVSKSTGSSPDYFISRDFLGGKFANGNKGLLSWIFFAISVSFSCFFSKNRANKALVIREVAELAWLLDFLTKNKITHLYNFFPYEKDANLIALGCKSQGIKTTLIPSSGPLRLHNHTMVADEVVFVTPYHYEEYDAILKGTILCDKILKWVPEKAFTYIDRYAGNSFEENKYVLGFYSHGSWLRSEQGHSSDGLNLLESEERVLRDLNKFLQEDPRFSVIVFTHPRERNASIIAQTEKYYSDRLPSGKFSLANSKTKTAEAFELVDIAVAAYSSIVYERLFCGFKMIIGTEGIDGFPMKNSSLEKISYIGYESMKSMLLQFSEMSKEEFFIQLNLIEYRYTSYNQWS
jgi:hypothetical protein